MLPSFSVIIPCLNEADNLPRLLRQLAKQQVPRPFEIIIADGGSHDDTLALAQHIAECERLALSVIKSAAGRAIQMNEGARRASSNDLLFLHADSELPDSSLLSQAKATLEAQRRRKGSDRIAGHFGLRFNRTTREFAFAYFFYEAKTYLNRPDSINGDQGIWLSRRFFHELGQFDTTLSYMEDSRLAMKVSQMGEWIKLPGCLTTSARRFEVEGLKERQILNALLRNFDSIGMTDFFVAAANAYRSQSKVERLRLKPFLRIAHDLSLGQGLTPAIKWWYKTGGYVAANAWQMAFAWDCRINRRLGLAPGEGKTRCLQRYEAWGRPLVTSSFGAAAAALVTLIWFYARLLTPMRK